MDGNSMRRIARRVGIIGFEGASALDITGPLEAFSTAGRTDGRADARGHYETILLGLTTRPFRSEYGVRLVPDARLAEAPPLDTLIVAGGAGLREPATNAAIADLAADACAAHPACRVRCARVPMASPPRDCSTDGASPRTGASRADLARRFPKLRVVEDALFVKDGSYYTSGGIAAGIDLALALIEEDLGPAVGARRRARDGRVSEAARRAGAILRAPAPAAAGRRPVRRARRVDDGHLDRDLGVVAARRAREHEPEAFRPAIPRGLRPLTRALRGESAARGGARSL